MTGGKIPYSEETVQWWHYCVAPNCHLPAVIFASISTRESAGISSSGNSTRSRMGMLRERESQWQNLTKSRFTLTLVPQLHRALVRRLVEILLTATINLLSYCLLLGICIDTGNAGRSYLLMLNILSIFLIPSQLYFLSALFTRLNMLTYCRMSGIKAWNLMSFTPAIFSVRLK